GKPNQAAQNKTQDKLPSVCPSCSYVKPIGVHQCPNCDFAPERQSAVETAPGTLTLVKRRDRGGDDRPDVYSHLVSVQERYGYKPGWVYHQFVSYFNEQPLGLVRVNAEPTPEVLSWVKARSIHWAKSKQKTQVICPRCGGADVKRSRGTGPHAGRADC